LADLKLVKLGHKSLPKEISETRTRAQEQSYINHLCILGKISMAEWRKKFDELSDVKLWGPQGKLKK
jgi:hypothetical protein